MIPFSRDLRTYSISLRLSKNKVRPWKTAANEHFVFGQSFQVELGPRFTVILHLTADLPRHAFLALAQDVDTIQRGLSTIGQACRRYVQANQLPK